MYTRKAKACHLLSCTLKLRFDYSSEEDGHKLAAIICFSVQLPRKFIACIQTSTSLGTFCYSTKFIFFIKFIFISFAVYMKTLCSIKIQGTTFLTTQCDVPEHLTLLVFGNLQVHFVHV